MKKLLLNTKDAAELLDVAPATLDTSRTTGKLLGRPAPKHEKFGRTVKYKMAELEAWANGTDSNAA